MNNFFRTLLAGYGAWRWGGGCLGTILVFVLNLDTTGPMSVALACFSLSYYLCEISNVNEKFRPGTY
jgi:hypothetical protein